MMPQSSRPPKQFTLAQRLNARAGAHKRYGEVNANWASEALDLYLLGEPSGEIARAYDKSTNCVISAIKTEALYRLMRAAGATVLGEVSVLRDGKEDDNG